MTATLGVCVLPEPAPNAPRSVRYGPYIHEILGHAGLCYDTLALEDLPRAFEGGLRILLTIGEYPLPESLKTELESWVAGGGAWLSVGGMCGMIELLGATVTSPSYISWGGSLRSLGEGYLQAAQSDHPLLKDVPCALHFFGGIAVEATSARTLAGTSDAHGRAQEAPALLENRIGAGRCLLLAPDVTGTIVHIQQGHAVTRDGIPAPDGTAPTNDGVLKSDDGQVLDWLLDRSNVPGAAGLRAFLHPVADEWKNLLLRAIFYLAEKQNATLPLLWYYPDNLPALGHISHDSDGNEPEHARRLLAVLKQAEIHSTWCVILPGYPPEIINAIRDAGHELALHFDALSDNCAWNEERFEQQWRTLSDMFNAAPTTNKNHYLRWEGDTEFFEWCIRRGITMDQSKGASKTGEAGFNFGTCHPYRPVAPDGRVLPIHELTTPTQDLLVFAPEAIVAPLLEAVVRHYGILHLLFHPAHIDKPDVADSLLRAIAAGQEKELQWWTAAAISCWENARRAAKWQMNESGATLTAAPDAPLGRATLLVLAPHGSKIRVNDEIIEANGVERWGFHFHCTVRDIAADETLKIEVIQ